MYREVFFVDEPVLMVPKLYVTLPTCLLRVVDNDSGEELTRVFQKVAPNNLKKNKVLAIFLLEKEDNCGKSLHGVTLRILYNSCQNKIVRQVARIIFHRNS